MKSSVIAAIALTLGFATQVFAQDQGNNLVVPLNSNAFGASYSEWSARWWEWAYSIPADKNPIRDTTGANCNQTQSGPVFFLAGTDGGAATRSCTIPGGKALFFPIVNTLFGSGVGDCAPTASVPCNLADLRNAAAGAVDPSVVQLSLTIDQNNIGNLVRQRVQSPDVTITLPANNIIPGEVPAGTYFPQVGDGYYVMVPPLSPGTHRIHFKAVFSGGPFMGFVIEVTYMLTVQRTVS